VTAEKTTAAHKTKRSSRLARPGERTAKTATVAAAKHTVAITARRVRASQDADARPIGAAPTSALDDTRRSGTRMKIIKILIGDTQAKLNTHGGANVRAGL
jgi:hypothetical protein